LVPFSLSIQYGRGTALAHRMKIARYGFVLMGFSGFAILSAGPALAPQTCTALPNAPQLALLASVAALLLWRGLRGIGRARG